ncbi:MAG: hypothetical protein ABI051_09620 [Vicinamibacterales bacterium]
MPLALVSLMFVTALVPVAQKAVPIGGPLAAAQAIRCSFRSFAATEWKDGQTETVVHPQEFVFQVDTINIKKRTGRFVVGTASVPVSVFLTQTGLDIIEQTPLGNFILTSVFAAGGAAGAFPAIHSRHLGDLATPPSASQHFGTCEIQK